MNYFNYFTEIEDRFQQRRGSLLMLSTLDWALIESWREAGVPLEAVLRGIDSAFDRHDAQRLKAARRQRKVNGLAWCAQAVLEAVEQTREASVGMGMGGGTGTAEARAEHRDSGFESAPIARYLLGNAAQLEAAARALATPVSTATVETAARLRDLAAALEPEAANPEPLDSGNLAGGSLGGGNLSGGSWSIEELDRTLTVLEEKIFAALLTSAPEDQLVALRAQADRELAPYRGKMQSVQIKQIQQQLLHKRLLEAHNLPRLSLFYMPHQDEL